jgi:hypothetical protein
MTAANLSRSLACSCVVAGTVTFSGVASAANESEHFKYYDESSYTATVTKEMAELDTLYNTAISRKVSQGEAEQARQKMVKLSRHLLQHLNERNASINIKEGAALSPTEILLNIRVMGRVLDILVADTLPHEDDWSYTY